MHFGSIEYAEMATALAVVAEQTGAFFDFDGGAALRVAATFAATANYMTFRLTADVRYADWAEGHYSVAHTERDWLSRTDFCESYAWALSRGCEPVSLKERRCFLGIARFEALHVRLRSSGALRTEWEQRETALASLLAGLPTRAAANARLAADCGDFRATIVAKRPVSSSGGNAVALPREVS